MIAHGVKGAESAGDSTSATADIFGPSIADYAIARLRGYDPLSDLRGSLDYPAPAASAEVASAMDSSADEEIVVTGTSKAQLERDKANKTGAWSPAVIAADEAAAKTQTQSSVKPLPAYGVYEGGISVGGVSYVQGFKNVYGLKDGPAVGLAWVDYNFKGLTPEQQRVRADEMFDMTKGEGAGQFDYQIAATVMGYGAVHPEFGKVSVYLATRFNAEAQRIIQIGIDGQNRTFKEGGEFVVEVSSYLNGVAAAGKTGYDIWQGNIDIKDLSVAGAALEILSRGKGRAVENILERGATIPWGIKPAPGTRVIPDGIPKEWRIRPTETPGGTWYYDPKNKGNAVRIMQGQPNSPHINSRSPYVRWQRNGQALDANGNVVPKRTPDAHIPLGDFKFDPEIFK